MTTTRAGRGLQPGCYRSGRGRDIPQTTQTASEDALCVVAAGSVFQTLELSGLTQVERVILLLPMASRHDLFHFSGNFSQSGLRGASGG
jgi:hypothetical protein